MNDLKIIVNGQNIDYYSESDFGFGIVKKYFDNEDINSVNRDYTIGLSLPKTDNNFKIFSYLGDVQNKYNWSNVPEFSVQMYSKGVEIFDGIIVIDEITEDAYDVTLFSNSVSWLSNIENKTLRDISNFPKFKYSGIRESNQYPWTEQENNTIGLTTINEYNENDSPYGCVFPLIAPPNFPTPDEGTATGDKINPWNNVVTIANSAGVIDGAIYANDADDGIATDQLLFRPACFLKTTLKKLFEDVGYYVGGSYINDDNIDDYILPFVDSNDTGINWNYGLLSQSKYLMYDVTAVYNKADGLQPSGVNNICGVLGGYRVPSPTGAGTYYNDFYNPAPNYESWFGYLAPNIQMSEVKYDYLFQLYNVSSLTASNNFNPNFSSETSGKWLNIGVNAIYDISVDFDINKIGIITDEQDDRFDDLPPEMQDGFIISLIKNYEGAGTNVDEDKGDNRLFFGDLIDPDNPNPVGSTGKLLDYVYIDSSYVTSRTAQDNGTYREYLYSLNQTNFSLKSIDTKLEVGDNISIVVFTRNDLLTGLGQFNSKFYSKLVTLDNFKFIINNIRKYESGEEYPLTFDPAKNLPDINQKEFLKSIAIIFNLKYDVDTDNKIVNINYVDNVLNNYQYIDMSDKVSEDDFTISRANPYSNIKYKYTKEDDAILPTLTNEDRDYTYTNPSTSARDTKEIEVLFAESFNRRFYFYQEGNFIDNLILPCFENKEELSTKLKDVSSTKYKLDWNPRILKWQGTYNVTDIPDFNDWFGVENLDVGRVDDDFNFKLKMPYALADTNLSWNNLYSNYWSNFINYLGSSIKVNTQIKLDSFLFNNINQYTSIKINNQVYLVGMIDGFDPVTEEPVEIELYKK